MTDYVYKVSHSVAQDNNVDIQRNPKLIPLLKGVIDNKISKRKGTIGILAGRFHPLHTGHIALILRAAKQVSHLVVVVDSAPNESIINKETNHVTLPPRMKYRMVTEELSKYDHISVVGINEACISDNYPIGDDGKISDYEPGFVSWWNLIKASVGNVPIAHYFSSEETAYKSNRDGQDLFAKYVGDETSHIILDPLRKATDISATKIREDHNKYWHFVPDSVKKIYTKKVTIIGAPSNGKSSITKYLAQVFRTSYVSETGGDYYRNIGDWEDLEQRKDYLDFAAEQWLLEKQAIRNSNKVSFCDTSFETIINYYKSRFNILDKDVEDGILKSMRTYHEEAPSDIYINIESKLPFNPEFRMAQELGNKLHESLLNDVLKGQYININGTEEENFDRIQNIIYYTLDELDCSANEMAKFLCSFSKKEQNYLNSVPRINNRAIIRELAAEGKLTA